MPTQPTTRANSELIRLYSKRILELAAHIPYSERLPHPDITIKKRSPLCGSTTEIDLCFEQGRITAFGQHVRACALGQAAAAIIGEHIIGRTYTDMVNVQRQLTAMLKNNAPPPNAPFAALYVLQPAYAYKNRHPSIMLTVDAIVDGFCSVPNHFDQTRAHT